MKFTKYRRRKKRSKDERYHLYDSIDGLHGNRLWRGRHISRYRGSVSMFESDNVYLEAAQKGGTSKEVSIMHGVYYANRFRSNKINRDMDLVNRKA